MLLLVVAAGFGVVLLAHTAPFPFLLDMLRGSSSVWRVPADRARQAVYLTFDDGPNPEATPALLDVLAREGARATFFLIDRHVTAETAHIVRRMFAEGHAVALHSHTRALMLLTPSELAATLTAAADRIERIAGARPCPAFRPHAGWRSGSMYSGLERIDHTLVGWGWQLWDWNWYRRRDAARIAERLAERVSPGDIIVMHDGHHEDPRADRQYAVDAAAQLIPKLRAKGYTFDTICGSVMSQSPGPITHSRHSITDSPDQQFTR